MVKHTIGKFPLKTQKARFMGISEYYLHETMKQEVKITVRSWNTYSITSSVSIPWQDTSYAVDLCVLVQISPGNRFEMRDDGLIRHAGSRHF